MDERFVERGMRGLRLQVRPQASGLWTFASPVLALVLTVLIGLVLLQGGPSWAKAVGFVTAALVISLAMGPISLEALRRQAPTVPRPYRLPAARWLCPLAFVLATWAIFWCGWGSLQLAVPLILVPSLGYLLVCGGARGGGACPAAGRARPRARPTPRTTARSRPLRHSARLSGPYEAEGGRGGEGRDGGMLCLILTVELFVCRC
jgi:amino acid transporter